MQVLCCPACLATIEQDRLKVGVEDPEFDFVAISRCSSVLQKLFMFCRFLS